MFYHRLKIDVYNILRGCKADSPLGHRCHNFLQLMKNWLTVESDEQREHLRRGLRRTAEEIDRLR